MSLNWQPFLIFLVWTFFFGAVAGHFVHGVPYFILIVINAIMGSQLLLPKGKT
jgi:hypothetical protein